MPHIFGHDSKLKWSERQDFHLRPRGPKPRALKTELRSDKMADPKGLAPSAFPQTTGCSGYLSYGSRNGLPGRSLGEGWWEVLVMLQSSLPTVIFYTGFTDRQPEHLPNWLRGQESHLPDEVYEASLCTLVEFPAVKWWSRWVPPPYELACRASALLVCHDPIKIGKPPWCCPRQAEFWRLCCTSWCAAYWNPDATEVRNECASEAIGAVAGNRTRTCALAQRHSPFKSQPHRN